MPPFAITLLFGFVIPFLRLGAYLRCTHLRFRHDPRCFIPRLIENFRSILLHLNASCVQLQKYTQSIPPDHVRVGADIWPATARCGAGTP
ncbi:hypothetical protein WJ87_11670 [Burkholderia ubonensis]|nr:hypothetical protein WJ87_11670 [Burkholderia ubonensis]